MNMRSCKCELKNKTKLKAVGDLSKLLKIISDHSRLQILGILQNGEHCVCELMEHTQLSQSLISHHLKDLLDTSLVSKRIDSKWSHYSLTKKGQNITNLIFKIKL